MQIYVTNSDGTFDITNVVADLTVSGEYRDVCRQAKLKFIKSPTDLHTWTVSMNLGNEVLILQDGVEIFRGFIFNRDKTTESNTIEITCFDAGIYLKKNKASYNFKGKSPADIVNQVCADFGIQTGDIANPSASITRKFVSVDLYSIIMTAYTLADDKTYQLIFEKGKLNVWERGQVFCKDIASGYNLISVEATETLEEMINKVLVYDKDDKLINTTENKWNQQRYGTFTEHVKVDEKEDWKTTADKTLKGIESKITVENFGDISYITGKAVVVKEPFHGFDCLFYIDGDEHTFRDGIYRNKLTLNFENIMDEQESGSEEE